MAYTQHGDQDFIFGFDDPDAEAIAAAIGLKPMTLSIQASPEFEAEGKDEDGMTTCYVVGQDKFTFTLTGYIVDKTLFNATAPAFDFEGKKFIVNGKKRDLSNTDLMKGEVSGVAFAGIPS
ncbi:hypothetical protein EBZ80_14260 [bacterium]|nr:hypothetical protein [bacterium]